MSKVLIIHHSGFIGGAGVSLLQVINMISSEHDVTVYCPKDPTDMIEYLGNNSIKVVGYKEPLGYISRYSGGPKILTKTFIKGIININKNKLFWKNVIEKENPDVVIVNSLITSWLGRIIKSSGRKAICFVRETFIEKRLDAPTYYIKYLLNNFFDTILFLSDYDREKSKCHIPHTQVIRNTIDLEKISVDIKKKMQADVDGEFTITFVGGMSKLKGTLIVLKALNKLKNYNVRLKIFGYFSEESYKNKRFNILELNRNFYSNRVHRYINKNNLEKMIEVEGTVTQLENIFSESDILIFPSIKPHQARPIFEAGAFKIPVIATDFPHIYEQLTHNYNGLLFKNKNYNQLAKNIELLLLDAQLRTNMGNNNFTRTMYNNDVKVVRKKLLDAINLTINS